VPTVTSLDVPGRTSSVRLGSLNATTYTYDGLDRLSRVTTPSPASVATDYTYNAFGQTRTTVRFATSTTPATTTSTYDAAGRLLTVNGPRTDVTDATTYDYDLAGRLISAKQEGITAPGGTPGVTTTYTYDDAGELVRVSQPLTSALTQVRDFTFDTSGRMASAVETRGSTTYTTTYTYGAGDQLEQIGDPRGITLKFEYDNLGRRTRRYQQANPLKDEQTFTYDQAGNMLSAKVMATGTTIGMDYDNDARIWKVYQASAKPTTTYAYDPASGRLSSVVDAAGTTSLTYRAIDGQIDRITDPFSPTQVAYSYDDAGRITRRTDASGTCSAQAYEAGTGRVDYRKVFPNTSCTGSYLARFDLGYDASSNVTSRIQYVSGNASGSDTTPFAYTYDGADRLLTATGPGSFSRTYAYDGGGNRTSVRVGTGSPVTTTYDSTGLPASSSDGTTYTHDALGNLTLINRSGTKNDRYFTYSSWSALTKSAKSASGSDITYALDALDRVLTRTEGSTTASYTYEGAGETLAKAVVGASTTTYAHTPGGPLAQKSGTTTRYYIEDLHGDLVAWSDTAATLKGTAAYDPFGQVLSTTGEMATIPSQGSFRFQGDLTDLTTGQVEMGARYYEPVLGRFSSRDRLFGEPASPLSLNQYVYGMGNPVTFSDPSGLRPLCGEGCTQEEEQEVLQTFIEAQTQATQDQQSDSPALAAPSQLARFCPPSRPCQQIRVWWSQYRFGEDYSEWLVGEDIPTAFARFLLMWTGNSSVPVPVPVIPGRIGVRLQARLSAAAPPSSPRGWLLQMIIRTDIRQLNPESGWRPGSIVWAARDEYGSLVPYADGVITRGSAPEGPMAWVRVRFQEGAPQPRSIALQFEAVSEVGEPIEAEVFVHFGLPPIGPHLGGVMGW
jgi:RHS repeat-associated protein